MGRIYDALRRAEEDRRQREASGRSEPVVVGLPDFERVEPVEGRAEPAVVVAEPAGTTEAIPKLELEAPAELVAIRDPQSPAAEHLRAIRARVLRTFEERGYRSLLVSSPGRGEGKSTTAANLALLLAAEIDRRVLLVDADLRKPAVSRLFGLPEGPGLAEVALGRVAWPQVVRRAPWNGLAVLPAGGRATAAAELLNSPAARQFLQEARAAYDFVVIDTAPVLPVADAVVLARLVDATLLVARARRTPLEALVASAEALGKATLLGVVLNALPESALGQRGYATY